MCMVHLVGGSSVVGRTISERTIVELVCEHPKRHCCAQAASWRHRVCGPRGLYRDNQTHHRL